MTRTTSLMEQIAMAEKKKFKREARMGNVSRLPIFSRIFLNFFLLFLHDRYVSLICRIQELVRNSSEAVDELDQDQCLSCFLPREKKKNCFHCSDDVNWSLHALYLSNSISGL
jgi:hypothetical protein